MSNFETKDQYIIDEITSLAEQLHSGQKRKTISIITGKSHEYILHPKEVANRAYSIIKQLFSSLPLADQALLNEFPEIIDIISLMHDVVEDCHFNSNPYEYLKNKLLKLNIPQEIITICLNGIQYLTKDRSIDNKNIQRKEAYTRLRQAPLWIKLIKLADEWHNLSTLSGKDFNSALQNYIKIRQSWSVIFTKEELEILMNNNFIEPEKIMKLRTRVFNLLNKKIQNPDSLLKNHENTLEKLYKQSIQVIENGFYSSIIQKHTHNKILAMCEMSSYQFYNILSFEGESQLITISKTQDNIKEQVFSHDFIFVYQSIQTIVEFSKNQDKGDTSLYHHHEAREFVAAFLKAINMSGTQFLETITSTEAFDLLRKQSSEIIKA